MSTASAPSETGRLTERADRARRTGHAHVVQMRDLIDRCATTIAGLDCGGQTASLATPMILGEGVVLDGRSMEVTQREGRTTRLTPTEWRVLALLLRSRGRVVPKQELARQLFGLADERVPEVEVYVSRLRDKLGGERGSIVETVRGRGYRLRAS